MISNELKSKPGEMTFKSQSPRSSIESNNTALLLIDIQERLVNAIPNSKGLVNNVRKIVDSCSLLGVSIHITEQNPEKLGETVSSVLPKLEYIKYTKSSFSCIECLELIKKLKKDNIENILICGLESHICVLQSSLDLIRSGFNVYVIADSIKSRGSYDHEISIARLRDSGAIISTTETTIFELCQSSANQNFKSISQIIKRSE